jgi:hypothetical protein
MTKSENTTPTQTRSVHRLSYLVALLLLLLLAVSGAAGDTGELDTTPPLIKQDELIFAAHALAGGVTEGIRTTAEGLTESGTYTSLPIAAPLPFTDVGPQWIIDVPAGAGYSLEVRTGLDGETWGDWIPVEGELDWMQPETGEIVGELVPVPQSVRLHNTVQYRWHFEAAPDGRAPTLRQLRLAFIDAGVTPTARTLATDGSYPKPAVVSRTGWACPEGEVSPRWPPEYEPVTHIIIHHTVTPNDDTDYAARVRSIWAYHANTRGWGDIGYNYLVARDGTLFVGRAGGNDVVGGHAYPGNYGSLGLAFMGTFVSDPVPSAMLQGAAELMAWKADQKGIDPHGWGWLYSSDPANASDRWIHTISGHRDVWYTACPGDVLYGHIPMLRDEVAYRLDEYHYTFVDDLDSEPEMRLIGDDYWFHGPDGCGYDGHAYWTYSVTTLPQSTNAAEWRPTLPASGAYRVYAYVPYCINGVPDSSGVYYDVHHAAGTTTVAVSQAAAAGGWVDLGVYDFAAGTSGYVHLDDLSDDPYRTVWFDAIRWYREGPGTILTLPPNNLHPADNIWSDSHAVTFRWSESLTEGVTDYQIIMATNQQLSDPFHTADVDYAGSDWDYAFLSDHAQVYWGVRALGPTGWSPPSTPWRLGIDTVAPTASISGVYLFPDGHYSVFWDGEDATSGIATFDVEYKVGTTGDWTPWLTDTALAGKSLPFSPSQTVFFRCRAADVAGNQGAFDDGSASTAGAVLLDHQSFLALVMRAYPPEP